MNNMYLKWAVLQLKKNIMQVSFWILILIIIAATYVMKTVSYNHDSAVKVLIYPEDNKYSKLLCDNLIDSEYEGYIFEKSESIENIEKQIARGNVNVGIVITEEIEETISSGEFDDQIKIYQAPDSVNGYLLEEIIFPNVIALCSNSMVEKYLYDKVPDIDKQYVNGIKERNEYLSSNMSMDIYNIKNIDVNSTDFDEKSESHNMLTYVILAIAVIIWILTNIGSSNNVINSVSAENKLIMILIETFVPIALMACIVSVVFI